MEKLSTTDQYIKIDLPRDSEGFGSFRDIDGAWSRSLFPGDVSVPRRTDDKLCYCFCLFILIKLLKEKHEKGGVNGVGFVASSGVRIQPWSTPALQLHVCHRRTGAAASKKKRKCASMPRWLFWILVSFGIFIYLFIWSTPPSSQQKAIIKGGKKIGKEWERIEELNETFFTVLHLCSGMREKKKLKTHVHTVNAQKSLQCHVLKGGLCWL